MKAIKIGVDIGGTNTVFGIVDKIGNILSVNSMPTQGHKNVETFVKKLSEKIKNEISKLNFEYELKGIGIGAPNGNINKGTIEFAPNLNWGEIVPLADLIKKQFNIPVKLTNDANAAAMGEMLYGGAKNMQNFIFITLGTGLGSGIVANGKLIYGHDGFAGEMGHVTVIENGRQCGCGRKGCLETYASATGINRTVFELLANKTSESSLRNIPFSELSSKIIYDKALDGDKIAIEAFDFTAKILGKALSNAVTYFSPEAIFFFGGLANAKELLLEPVKKYMEENLMKIYKNKILILPSKIKEGDAAILGASAIID